AGIAETVGRHPLRVLAEAVADCAPAFGGQDVFEGWLGHVAEVAGVSPKAVAGLAKATRRLLPDMAPAHFNAWLVGGLRAAAGDGAQLRRYLALDLPLSRRLLHAESDAPTLGDVSRTMGLFTRALWGRTLRIETRTDDKARRATFDGPRVRVPERFKGFGAVQTRRLFHATAAHVAAHLEFSGDRFPVGGLKPLQLALVGLVEDARVETLALRRYPGLVRLWRPFHVARPGGALVAEALMARLARALIDPDYADDNPWVVKGRALFAQAAGRLEDPAVSRHIGNLLGNDLGQMRVQFNAKAFVIEPAYRDDNLGLWQFDAEAPPDPAMAEAVAQGARIEHEESDAPPEDDEAVLKEPSPDTGGADPPEPEAVAVEVAVPVARYPEWDFLIARERPDWATVVATEVGPGSADEIRAILERHDRTVQRVRGIVRRSAVGRTVRLRRQPEGEQLDLDACIEAAVDRRFRRTPDVRVYRSERRLNRDMSVLLLLDVSKSTGDPVGAGETVLDLVRAAASLLATALADMHDPFAIHAFCSNGRNDVHDQRVKGFAEPFDDHAMARLAGLRSDLSTRLGAALRHAGRRLAARPTHRRLLLVITDGEPADVDVPDRRYLVEDARRAVHDLARAGIDVYCVGLDPGGHAYMARVFGPSRILILENVRKLPEKLARLYLRLRA
ncbi:MAG: VWA domain-containing protein, partial [Rhodobacterales bacterium]|nr:VWA domain-containing protein [Rhodobacterales bacterium]